MPQPRTPFDVGYSDGELGLRFRIPQGYSAQEAEQYGRGYDKGYDYYLKKLDYANRRSSSQNYGPYLDSSWIPKDGHY